MTDEANPQGPVRVVPVREDAIATAITIVKAFSPLSSCLPVFEAALAAAPSSAAPEEVAVERLTETIILTAGYQLLTENNARRIAQAILADGGR